MNSFEQLGTFWIEIGLMIVFSIVYYFIQRQNNLKLTLQYLLYSYGIFMLLLSLKIPYVFPGFPDEISDLENKKRLLYHLKINNEALSETTQTIREMALLTFGLLIAVVSKIIKFFKLEKTSE